MDHLSGDLRTLIELTRRGGFSPAAKARIWRRIELGLELRTCEARPLALWSIGSRWLVVCAAAAACLVAPRWLAQEPAAQHATAPALASNAVAQPVNAREARQATPQPAAIAKRRIALRKPVSPHGRTSALLQQVAEELAQNTQSTPAVDETPTSAPTQLAELSGELGGAASKRVDQALARPAAVDAHKPSLLETLRRDALERRRAAIGERALLASARRSLPSIGGYSD